MFDDHLARWDLTPDGAPIVTHSSRLLPVRRGGEPAMLKIAIEAAGLERKRLLQWILAYAGLSAAWILGDGETPELDVAVAELAAAELARS